MDLIEEHLYLGELAAAADREVLSANEIKRILTVETSPLPASITEDPGIEVLYVEAEDMEDADLLSHFNECIAFINHSVNRHKNVLVHCYFGISRSATIVCAYLMWKYHWNFDKALSYVREKRTFVSPNDGFTAQLELFAYMKWTVNVNSLVYQLYLLQMLARKHFDEKVGVPFEEFSALLANINKETDLVFKDVYKCKHCRKVVLNEDDVFTHRPGQVVKWENVLGPEDNTTSPCRISLFVKPKLWMKTGVKGKILCPYCRAKLGSFAWAGSKCPCGARMTPMYYVSAENVDLERNSE